MERLASHKPKKWFPLSASRWQKWSFCEFKIVYIFTRKFTSSRPKLGPITSKVNRNKLTNFDPLLTSFKMDGRMRAPQKSKRVGLNNKQQLKVRSTSKIPEFETDKRADKKSMGKCGRRRLVNPVEQPKQPTNASPVAPQKCTRCVWTHWERSPRIWRKIRGNTRIITLDSSSRRRSPSRRRSSNRRHSSFLSRFRAVHRFKVHCHLKVDHHLESFTVLDSLAVPAPLVLVICSSPRWPLAPTRSF